MKSSNQIKRCCMHRQLSALVIVVIMVLTSLTSVVAKEVTKDNIENIELFVSFKNGTSTLRKGSNGLKDVKFYDAELIKTVKLSTVTLTSGDVADTNTISKILKYVISGDFDANPPVEMLPRRKKMIYPNNSTKTIYYRDGSQKVYRGYEISNIPKIDVKLVESSVFDRGDGSVNKTIYGKSQNYIITEAYKFDKLLYVMLNSRKNYVPIGGTIVVTRKDGWVERFEGADIDKVKSIHPTRIQKIEIYEAPSSEETPEPTTTGKRVNFYDLSRDQVAVINKEDFKYGDVVAYRRADCTEVDFIYPIFYSKQWFSNSSQTYIIDPKSGEKYQLQSVARGVPIDRYVRVIDQVGKSVLFTLVFPPLPKDVNSINILSYKIEGQPTPAKANGTGPWLRKDIKVLGDVERAYKELK